ncbi:MAG: hypothetical protein WA823_10900 [Candidatus Acidiferrales bacterium]
MKEKHKKAVPFETEAEANTVLHSVADEASFREFEARLHETQKSRGVRLLVRRRRVSGAFAFVPVTGQANKADFLYSDGAARGRALWTSLWRAVKVQFVEASREQ